MGGKFSALLAPCGALSAGGLELPGLVGNRGASSPPVDRARGTAAAPVPPRASVGSASAGGGRGHGSGSPVEAGPFLRPVCASLQKLPQQTLCPFSRGETCTQWWKTAAVPSSHPATAGVLVSTGRNCSGCGHPLWKFDVLFRLPCCTLTIC